jgi:hypothetical protein
MAETSRPVPVAPVPRRPRGPAHPCLLRLLRVTNLGFYLAFGLAALGAFAYLALLLFERVCYFLGFTGVVRAIEAGTAQPFIWMLLYLSIGLILLCLATWFLILLFFFSRLAVATRVFIFLLLGACVAAMALGVLWLKLAGLLLLLTVVYVVLRHNRLFDPLAKTAVGKDLQEDAKP